MHPLPCVLCMSDNVRQCVPAFRAPCFESCHVRFHPAVDTHSTCACPPRQEKKKTPATRSSNKPCRITYTCNVQHSRSLQAALSIVHPFERTYPFSSSFHLTMAIPIHHCNTVVHTHSMTQYQKTRSRGVFLMNTTHQA